MCESSLHSLNISKRNREIVTLDLYYELLSTFIYIDQEEVTKLEKYHVTFDKES